MKAVTVSDNFMILLFMFPIDLLLTCIGTRYPQDPIVVASADTVPTDSECSLLMTESRLLLANPRTGTDESYSYPEVVKCVSLFGLGMLRHFQVKAFNLASYWLATYPLVNPKQRWIPGVKILSVVILLRNHAHVKHTFFLVETRNSNICSIPSPIVWDPVASTFSWEMRRGFSSWLGQYSGIVCNHGPLLLTWFNFNPSMDK